MTSLWFLEPWDIAKPNNSHQRALFFLSSTKNKFESNLTCLGLVPLHNKFLRPSRDRWILWNSFRLSSRHFPA